MNLKILHACLLNCIYEFIFFLELLIKFYTMKIYHFDDWQCQYNCHSGMVFFRNVKTDEIHVFPKHFIAKAYKALAKCTIAGFTLDFKFKSLLIPFNDLKEVYKYINQ